MFALVLGYSFFGVLAAVFFLAPSAFFPCAVLLASGFVAFGLLSERRVSSDELVSHGDRSPDDPSSACAVMETGLSAEDPSPEDPSPDEPVYDLLPFLSPSVDPWQEIAEDFFPDDPLLVEREGMLVNTMTGEIVSPVPDSPDDQSPDDPTSVGLFLPCGDFILTSRADAQSKGARLIHDGIYVLDAEPPLETGISTQIDSRPIACVLIP